MTDLPLVDEDQLLAVFRALARHQVAYAVFGGIALGLHGLARATRDLDLFVPGDASNVERLKAALRDLFDDPNIDEISAVDLCGDYPAVRYVPPAGFGFDILTRLGEAFRYEDLEIEEKRFRDVPVRVVTPRTLWAMKRDTVRPVDRMDAALLAERFGFGDE
ncbi:MAG TPA: nucleotidyl transferase AbiEii/AbiGii toxin family protein [Thermoanaerobaculia bacterium]